MTDSDLSHRVQALLDREALKDAQVKALEHKLDHLVAELHTIRVALTGDPAQQDKPSILIRLDRAEQTLEWWSKVMWLISSATAGLVIDRMRALL